jgi:hypothetical protein
MDAEKTVQITTVSFSSKLCLAQVPFQFQLLENYSPPWGLLPVEILYKNF